VGCNIDVDARNVNGCTALHLAAKEGHNETVWELVRNGTDVNSHNLLLQTPLHCAAMCGDEETVRMLLEGCETTKDAVNVKHTATEVGGGFVTKIDARDANGQTALHYSANSGNSKAAKVLVEHKASTGVKDASGNSPLFVAVKNGHVAVAELLLDHEGLQDVEEGKVLLSMASNSGHIEVVKALVKNGATVITPLSLDEQKDCTVCLENCVAPIRISCGHFFCWACVVALQSKSFTECPNCRAKFDQIVF